MPLEDAEAFAYYWNLHAGIDPETVLFEMENRGVHIPPDIADKIRKGGPLSTWMPEDQARREHSEYANSMLQRTKEVLAKSYFTQPAQLNLLYIRKSTWTLGIPASSELALDELGINIEAETAVPYLASQRDHMADIEGNLLKEDDARLPLIHDALGHLEKTIINRYWHMVYEKEYGPLYPPGSI